MGTAARPRPGAGKRGRGSGRGGDREAATAREEQQFDLLTAALLGVVVGASATLLLRRGPAGSRREVGGREGRGHLGTGAPRRDPRVPRRRAVPDPAHGGGRAGGPAQVA